MSDRAALARLLADVPAGRPLDAVFHAAGSLDDGVIDSLTPGRMDAVLRGKATAARALHELTRDLDLSAFVLFSSTAGVLSGAGLGNYAPGNAYLDALAAERRAAGLPATAVSWGLWADGGMVGDAAGDRMRRHGVHPMDTAAACEALGHALDLGDTHVVVTDLRWDTYAPSFTAPRPSHLLDELPAARRALDTARQDSAPATADASSLHTHLAALPDYERAGAVLEIVRGHVAGVLGYPAADAVEPERPFTDLGIDSLSAVELRNGMNRITGLRLPSTLVFDHPNCRALADFLLAEVAADTVPATPDDTPRRSAAIDDDIAIVAMGCRFPGDIRTPEQLWRMLLEGEEGLVPFPEDRGWDLDALYDPDPGKVGTVYTRTGGFLSDAGGFDPAFFNISPREAVAMDPQQRLLLEMAWETFERAGIDPRALRGSRTGVFAGTNGQDYTGMLAASGEDFEGYMLTGNAASVVSGRLSYTFGLEGPAVTVDTACSASLVALHLAAQSLRSGECDMALAGGITVMASPGLFVDFSRQRGLAADGRCKAFADAADGTGFSEGGGLLLVERLSDARRLGHPVLAVVRGSAVNQDGASNGLSAPNGPAQQRVIRAALVDAGVSASEVDVVEAHGTGTTLGDPIEAQALLATYGRERAEGQPLWLGSVKSNVGHTQAGAGVAGVMKMVLAMRYGVLPATLHVDAPSSHVDWSSGGVELLTRAREWPELVERPRRAGVSSFGISGTNAHVVLEAVPEEPVAEQSVAEQWVTGEPVAEQSVAQESRGVPVGVPVPWVVSARSRDALRAQAAQLLDHVTGHPGVPLADTALALATTRTPFPHRAVLVGADRDGLAAQLRALADGAPLPGTVTGTARTGGRTAFLFTGQGAQRPGMGRELHAAHPVFAETFDAVCERVPGLRTVVLGDDAERLNRTEHAQPALFAFEVALYRLLESWGVRPDFVAGHSVGEIAAAHIAGVFSLDDACALVAARGRLMQALPAGGAMASVSATEEEVLPLLAGREHELGIAALNGPAATVVSGTEAAVAEVRDHFAAAGRRVTRLRVSHAFHSPLMDPVLDDFRTVATGISYAEPRVPVVSALTGEPATPGLLTDPEYWVRHVREPVRFHDCVTRLHGLGARRFLETGPDGPLSTLAETALAETAPDTADEALFVAAGLRDKPETDRLLMAVGALFAHGAEPDWAALLPGARTVPLPTYAFQRQRFWLPTVAPAGDPAGAGLRGADHPFLGVEVTRAGSDDLLFTGRLSLRSHPWLADHTVLGQAILPATGYLDLAVHVGDRADCGHLSELTLLSPLVVPAEGTVDLQVTVDAADETGQRAFAVWSAPAGNDAEWQRHAQGTLAPRSPSAPADDLAAWPPPGAEQVPGQDPYAAFAAAGFAYGPSFQGLGTVWERGDEVYAEAALPEPYREDAARYALHPALLDAAVQALLVRRPGLRGDDEATAPMLPFAWTGLTLHATGATALRVRLTPAGHDHGYRVLVTDTTGQPVATADAITLRTVSAAPGTGADRPELLCLDWQETLPAPEPPRPQTTRWIVLGTGDDRAVAALDATGVHLETYADLEALGKAVDTGMTMPDVVLVAPAPYRTGGPGMPETVRGHLTRAHDLMCGWLADDRFTDSRLVFVTRSAVNAGPDTGTPDVAGAALWGMVRSGQAEHPGRFQLVDLPGDAEDADGTALFAAVARTRPYSAVRDGRVLPPDAAPAATGAGTPDLAAGTVLVTGATGTLGRSVARHLVTRHGVRSLLLVSRRGRAADGADTVVAELTALGAQVSLETCDVAERADVERLLTRLPAGARLTGVVHAAGVADDAVLTALDGARFDTVLRPKADGAWHLHDLTARLDLAAFVLFSSAAGTFGAPGQSNYAAANAFLDGLAALRHSLGLPATSVAWGLWDDDSGITARLSHADRSRLARGGLRPLATEDALGLLDEALCATEPAVIAVAT
uniref:type I polyketide synthase n=1 Tax=Streptomyces europaeiscabiei TaxID=146819 RepID=UPI001F2D725F